MIVQTERACMSTCPARYPYVGTLPTSTGAQPVPFQNWDSDSVVIWAHSGARAHIEEALRGTGFVPVVTDRGTAVVSFWYSFLPLVVRFLCSTRILVQELPLSRHDMRCIQRDGSGVHGND